ELLHFRLPALGPRALVVIVSQSGRSAEVVRLAEALHGRAARPFVVAVTNGVENPLAGLADVAIDSEAGGGEGASPHACRRPLAGVAGMGRVLGGEWDLGRVIAAVQDDAERAASAIEGLLEDARGLGARLSGWLEDRPVLALLGRGTARAASEMGALTLKEAA